MLETNKVLCRRCQELIHEKAKTCPWCGARQSRGMQWLVGSLRTLPVLVSVATVAVLVIQLGLAERQTTTAEKQVELATAQKVEAEDVLEEVREVKQKAEGLLSEAVAFKEQSEERLASIRERTDRLQKQMEGLGKEIDDTSKQMEASLATFEQKQDGLSGEVVTLKEELSGEIAILKGRNELMALADKAIAEGDGESFDELLRRKNSINDNSPQQVTIGSELLRVKSFYLTAVRGKNARFWKTDEDGTRLYEEDWKTEDLINVLLSKRIWPYRIKAAKILGGRKEQDVPDALIDGLNDPILDVRKACIDSFEKIFEDYDNPDVLDGTKMIEWWNENKKAKLPELQ